MHSLVHARRRLVCKQRQIQTKVMSMKDKSYQLYLLRLQYAAYIASLKLSQKPKTPKKNALLVGINYIGTSNQLRGCINDIHSVKSRLTTTGFTCQVLTDETIVKPTRNNILNSFKTLLMNAVAGDMLFFQYSGHGTYLRDTNGDESDRRDEALVSVDNRGVLDDELKTLLIQYLKKDVTLFALFDCCHSGTILDLKFQYMDSLNGDADVVYPKHLATAGKVYMISGCTDQQTSADAFINNMAQGAMTWSWLESLKKNPTGTWRDLLKNMRVLLKQGGYNQLPQFSAGTLVDIDTKVFI
jgi:hypothetical protein